MPVEGTGRLNPSSAGVIHVLSCRQLALVHLVVLVRVVPHRASTRPPKPADDASRTASRNRCASSCRFREKPSHRLFRERSPASESKRSASRNAAAIVATLNFLPFVERSRRLPRRETLQVTTSFATTGSRSSGSTGCWGCGAVPVSPAACAPPATRRDTDRHPQEPGEA